MAAASVNNQRSTPTNVSVGSQLADVSLDNTPNSAKEPLLGQSNKPAVMAQAKVTGAGQVGYNFFGRVARANRQEMLPMKPVRHGPMNDEEMRVQNIYGAGITLSSAATITVVVLAILGMMTPYGWIALAAAILLYVLAQYIETSSKTQSACDNLRDWRNGLLAVTIGSPFMVLGMVLMGLCFLICR